LTAIQKKLKTHKGKAMKKTVFALFFGGRDLFPGAMIESARKDLTEVLTENDFGFIVIPEGIIPDGAVASEKEGKEYADFLKENEGLFDGVILCLPNFGDENGAVAALRDANVPILVQAYPDELNKMGPEDRRDAFCGKFSVMDVFTQFGILFTALPPHTVHPKSDKFREHLDIFSRICKVVKGMKRMRLGALGARTSAFKTVRFDELTFEKYGITTETLDLSEIFDRVSTISENSEKIKLKAETLKNYTCWKGVPGESFKNIVKLAVVIDDLINELNLDAITLRCWLEIEKQLKISPCVILSELNDRGIPAACELDGGNAVAMMALNLATGGPSACLDWNNNYGDDENKCVLFHCGPVPQKMMQAKGQIVDHPMFARVLGAGCGFGCNTGRIAPSPFTYASSMTKDGKLIFYLGEGEFTKDKLPKEFFGCGGVVKIDGLQNKLNKIGISGYRHHVSASFGNCSEALRRAFAEYLNYEVMDI
jgi:L-fucose isomerase-like protein